MKPLDVKSNTYIDSTYIVTTSKYQNISGKGYTLQIGLKKFL